MSLKGAKLICLSESGAREKIIKPEGKSFRFGYYITCDYVLLNPEAKSIHCEILIDAFSRITIVNYCNKNPITINGFPVKNQRPLFHGSKIKILNKEFVWHFSGKNDKDIFTDAAADSVDVLTTPSNYLLSEQGPLSEPWKMRNYKMKKRRLSVQSFATYSIGREELNKINESNNEFTTTTTTIDSYEIKENIPLDQENILTNKNTPKSTNKTNKLRRRTLDCLTPLTSALTETILINFNTSIYKDENMTPQAKLELCKKSDLLVTSYSPRTLNNRTPQSFAIIKSNKNTPQSIYGTPRSVLSEHNNEDSNDGTNLMNFSTPQRSGRNDYHKSMYLIDLTTPAIIQKTPVKQIVPSPLLKSALKNSTHKSAIKSVKTIKTAFAPVLEETNNSLNISSEKKKYPVTPSSTRSISIVRKSINMSINTKEKLTITPKKMKTPVKTTLIANESHKNLNVSATKMINTSNTSGTDSFLNYKTATSNLSIKGVDSTIDLDLEEPSINDDNDNEESIIVVTDDSIYSNESIRNISQTPQKETPDRKVYTNIAKKTPTSLIRKAIISSATKIKRSPNMLVPVSKRLPSASTSSTNLSSSKLTTTPLRKSLFTPKISPKNVGKSRLLSRSSRIGIDKSPAQSTSTPLRTNTLRKSTSLENRILPLVISKRPNIHSCKNARISIVSINSTPINSKKICRNTSAKQNIYLSKASPILNSAKIRNKVDRTNNTDVNKAKGDFEFGDESQLNQTFTVTDDEENQIKANETVIEEDDNIINTTSNVCMKTPEKKEKSFCNFKELVPIPNISLKENDLINVFGVKELLQNSNDILKTPNMKGIKELLQTPKQDIVNNFVGVKELLNTPKDHDSILNSTAIIELFKTPIKEPDVIKQFLNTPKIDQSILEDDQIFNTISAENFIVSSVTPENNTIINKILKSNEILESSVNFDLGYSADDIEDNIFKTPTTKITRQVSTDNYCERIESSDEIFEKLIGKPTITKQYSPAKKNSSATKKSCVVSIVPETPKTDIQEWIDNINESFISNKSCDNIENPLQEVYENTNFDCKSNSEEIHETQELKKYDDSEETLNKSGRNCNNISIAHLDETKSVFSEELVLSDKSEDDEFIDYQSTPNIRKKLSTTCTVNYTTPVRRSSRHLNKSYGCKQCLTPPTIFDLKNQLCNNLSAKKFDLQKEKEKHIIELKKNHKASNKTVDCSFNLETATEERETELAFENINEQPNLPEVKAKTPDVRKAKMQNNRKTLGNKTVNCSFDLKASKEVREKELAFENFNEQPNLPEVKANTPDVRKAKIQNNRKTLGNKTVDCSFDLKAAKEERETELAFENFTDQPNLPKVKANTPDVRKAKMQNNRKTLGNKTVDCSFDLNAAKEERETELVFENFSDQPHLPEVKAKTPDVRKVKMQNNRKTLGNRTVDCSFDWNAAKEERETELVFENFSDQPRLPEVKAKTPDVRKAKMQNNRKTLGNKTVDCSFDLKAAKEERETELAFENFIEQPNLPEVKAKTPDVGKAKMQNNRKTLGNKTVDCSFDLKAAKEEREKELAFENFTNQPNLPKVKANTPDVRKAKMQNNRKTLGNKTVDCSFDLKAAKEARETELVFENFSDQPHLPEEKAKTPDVRKAKMQNNRKTLGNRTVDCSFDLKAAKEARETELVFENFSDQPHLPEVKAKTPDVRKAKMQNNRKTLGNKTVECSFDLKAAKEDREIELAFENFNEQPNLLEVKAKTPDVGKAKMQNNRKTLGNKIVDCSFDLQAAKEEREKDLAFENFTDQPNLPKVKAKTPDVKKAKLQNNRKTLGNKTVDCSFDLKAAKEERETELAFENFNEQPNFPEVKAKTPDVGKAKMQNNRKTLGNKTVDCSFDLKAAKEVREKELAFENFTDQPNLPRVKAKTPDVKKTKMQNNRKTLGNKTVECSFDLKAAKEEREIELAFENFNEQPNLLEVKAKTPDVGKAKMQNNRKTLGNKTVDYSFDLKAAKEEREQELAFENFNDHPNLPEVKSKTPDARRVNIQNNRKTLGNQTIDTFFDLKAAKEEREQELAFENFNEQPNLLEVKSKTPDVKHAKIQNSRKSLGNQTVAISFDLKTAKEEREMELAFANFNDQLNFPKIKSKTPDIKHAKIQNNRKTLGNQIVNTFFDWETAKEEREKELAFENFNDHPNMPEIKAKTPDAKKTKMQNNRQTLGNKTVNCSFDLKAAKEERKKELLFANFNDQPNLRDVKAKTPDATKPKMQNTRKTLGNKILDYSFDLKAAKEEREKELAFENFTDQPNLRELKSKTPNDKRVKIQNDRKTLGNQTAINNSTTNKSLSTCCEVEISENNSTVKNIKTRGRPRKNSNMNECDQVHLFEVDYGTNQYEKSVFDEEIIRNTETQKNINDTKNNEQVLVKDTSVKRLGRGRKVNVKKEIQNYTDEQVIESTPIKGQNKTRNQIKNKNIDSTSVQKDDISITENGKGRYIKPMITDKINSEIKKEFIEGKEIVIKSPPVDISSTDKGKRRYKKPMITDKINSEIKKEFDEEEEIIKSPPVKRRGKLRNQRQTVIDNIDLVDDKENNVNKKIKVKRQGVKKNIEIEYFSNDEKNTSKVNIDEEVSTPTTRNRRNLKVKSYSEENNDNAEISSTSNVNRGTRMKNTVSNEVNINSEEDTNAQQKVTTRRNKTKKFEKNSETNTSIIDTNKKEIIPQTDDNTNSVSTDEHILLESCPQININPSNIPEFKTPTNKVLKKSALPARRLRSNSTATPVLIEENQTTVVVRRSKRKAADEIDSSASEEVYSAESITRGRRRRINTNLQLNNEDRAIKQINTEEGQENKNNEADQKVEIYSTLNNGKGRDKKHMISDEISAEIKNEFDEEKEIIKSPPVKGRGRTRNRRQTAIDNADLDDDKENSVNKKTKVKSQGVKKKNEIEYSTNDEEKTSKVNIDEEVCTPTRRNRRNLKVKSYSEENNDNAEISSTSNVNRGRRKKNNVSNDVNINSEEDSNAQLKVNRRRNKTKKSEINTSIIDTDKNENIPQTDDNTNSVSTDEHILLDSCQQININPSNIPEFKTPTNKFVKKSALPARRLRSNSTATPVFIEENETTVVVRRSKRKAADENDSSASEEVYSAESNKIGGRRRINTELQPSSEGESEPLKNTRSKKKLVEIPIEVDISEKRSTRKRN